jgi:hypothetical protein
LVKFDNIVEGRGGFVENLSQTAEAQQSVNKLIARNLIHLVIRRADLKLLFNKPASESLVTVTKAAYASTS